MERNSVRKSGSKAILIQGNVTGTLIRMTIPMIIGILGMSVFNLADTYFVGRLGPNELAAMSFTFPVILIIGSIAMGLGVGTSSVVSRAIGEGNFSRVKRLTTDSLVLSLCIVVLFVAAGLMTIEPLFTLLGAEKGLIPLIKQYMSIWYLGVPFVVIPMVGNNAIRATGDTKTPSLIMVVAIVINITLDPLLIFGFGPIPSMRLSGAALATLIARAFTMIVSLAVLYVREKMITLDSPSLKEVMLSWKNILFVGLPAAGTNLIMPLTFGILTRMIAQYGNNAIAAFGIGTRIDMFAMSIVMALASVVGPFVGQNWGAGKKDRVQKAVAVSHLFSFIWGIIIFLLFLIFSRDLAILFNNTGEIIDITSLYLIILSSAYGLSGILRLSGSAFNALNKPLSSTSLSILNLLVLTLPLSYAGSIFFGLKGIFIGRALANIFSGAAAYIWLRSFVSYPRESDLPISLQRRAKQKVFVI